MRNFSFVNPTRIEFGKGKEQKIGDFMSEFGVKRAILLYGSERIKNSGLYDIVASSLKQNGIEFIALGGIKSNPVLSKVNEAINLAREFKADSVLAVGGGSVLDSAKAVAAGVCYDGDVWDLFTGKSPKTALKIFDIITLAATGSEMNNGAVVTNENTAQKYAISGECLYPVVSVINPELQASVSRDYLVYSAADIIAHSIEGYFSATYHPELVRMQIEANIKTVIKTTEILLENPNDYDARAEFAWAATLALNGYTYLGVEGFSYPNHMLEHAMSAITDCAHGAGLSVVIPAWSKWYRDKNPDAFKRFSREIFGLNSADDGINALKAWFDKVGTPTSLKQLNIDDEILAKIIDNAVMNAKAWRMDKLYTKENITEIFALAK
ncbi:butanol dehydrogenase [Campylobacter mucosalis]|uniref:iron-containing alcohol dehydrogenase n=1 Tax=Campylobacter mucosalis TaxID=202 RepID=UPI0004D8351B|nr:iron-containing alcohol dehydrogenase [Campylobacter mucosalis]KEA46374.1 butanol dehydrogenase [Campylobacter mucosalis]QKF63143.1 iron-containing alcohol dehydrogenase [Campylobacter mucosalis]